MLLGNFGVTIAKNFELSWPKIIFATFLLIAGRVPPVYRGPVAPREVVRVHVVQLAGGQEEVLQEAREEDVTRGREKM